jgi:hypothetical protein
MSKVYPYTIHHLDHDQLIALERKVRLGEGSEKDASAVQEYTGLMSNKPRFDPTIRENFGSKTRTLEESVDDVKRDADEINETKLRRKASSAMWLFERGFYVKVADVDADTAQDAIKATTSVNHRWMVVHNKKLIPAEGAWRSTDSYDIIRRFDECFLKMPLGFIDLQEGNYARELV